MLGTAPAWAWQPRSPPGAGLHAPRRPLALCVAPRGFATGKQKCGRRVQNGGGELASRRTPARQCPQGAGTHAATATPGFVTGRSVSVTGRSVSVPAVPGARPGLWLRGAAPKTRPPTPRRSQCSEDEQAGRPAGGAAHRQHGEGTGRRAQGPARGRAAGQERREEDTVGRLPPGRGVSPRHRGTGGR